MSLKEAIDKLGNSRAIFKLELSGQNTRIESYLVDQYLPAYGDDALSMLVAEHYQETLAGDIYEKDYTAITFHSLAHIKHVIISFITAHGPYKNARQSAVFRFLSKYTLPDGANDGLVYLYVYMKSLGIDDQGRASISTDVKHIDNILAILELMRSKFESRS